MKITLTHEQYEELLTLEEGETIEVEFNGIDAFITPDPYGNIEYRGRKFTFNFFCPSEVTLSVKRAEKKAEEPKAEVEEEENTNTIIGAEFEPNKMHIYDVKTHGAHPVHLIDGGNILTEDKRDFGSGDMYWFFLNTKEYNYFKSKCHKIVLE
jgi:hypothetical protein